MLKLENFEDRARSGDLREARFAETLPDWAPDSARETVTTASLSSQTGSS